MTKEEAEESEEVAEEEQKEVEEEVEIEGAEDETEGKKKNVNSCQYIRKLEKGVGTAIRLQAYHMLQYGQYRSASYPVNLTG